MKTWYVVIFVTIFIVRAAGASLAEAQVVNQDPAAQAPDNADGKGDGNKDDAQQGSSKNVPGDKAPKKDETSYDWRGWVVLGFGAFALLLLSGIIVWGTSVNWRPMSVTRGFGLVLIVVAALFLVSVKFENSDKTVPIAFSLLSAIAGYLLGVDNSRTDDDRNPNSRS